MACGILNGVNLFAFITFLSSNMQHKKSKQDRLTPKICTIFFYCTDFYYLSSELMSDASIKEFLNFHTFYHKMQQRKVNQITNYHRSNTRVTSIQVEKQNSASTSQVTLCSLNHLISLPGKGNHCPEFYDIHFLVFLYGFNN